MSSESTPRADVSPLPNPVSPPGTPTTGSALDGRAVEMRARAGGVIHAVDRIELNGAYPSALEVNARGLARDVIALTEMLVGLSADVTRLEGDADGWEDAYQSALFGKQKAEAREAELRSALERIAKNAECSIGLGVSSKHGKFCAYHIARGALALDGFTVDDELEV